MGLQQEHQFDSKNIKKNENWKKSTATYSAILSLHQFLRQGYGVKVL